jgi:hypothetical protein
VQKRNKIGNIADIDAVKPFGYLLKARKASYWNVQRLVSWLVQLLLTTLTAPRNGVLYF